MPTQAGGSSSGETLAGLKMDQYIAQQRAIELWADATADTEEDSTNRRWETLGPYEMSYLLLSIASLVVLLALSTYAAEKDAVPAIVCCVSVFVETGFGVYFLVHGIRAERPYEMLCFMMTYLLICASLTIESFAFPLRTLKLVNAILSWVFSIPYIFICGIYFHRKYTRSRHLMVRTIMDHIDLEARVVSLYRCKALIVMNLQLGLIATVLSSNGPDSHSSLGIMELTIRVTVGVFFSLGAACLSVIFMIHEYRCCVVPVMFMIAGQLVVVAMVMVDAIHLLQSSSGVIHGNPYTATALLVSIVAILVGLVLVPTLIRVYYGFGYGANTLAFQRHRASFNPGSIEWYGSTGYSSGAFTGSTDVSAPN